MLRDIRIESGAFDPHRIASDLASECPEAGGIASFLGAVRAGGGVEALELSHYEPITLAGMEALADDASTRFDLLGLAMIHRIGHMVPGDPIVCVAAASRHRRDAIEAIDFCMDHLKSAAWFWKRELRSEGAGSAWHWIEPREQDYSDKDRWKK